MEQTRISKSCEECKLRKVRCESRSIRLRSSVKQTRIFTFCSTQRRQCLGLQQLHREIPGSNHLVVFVLISAFRGVMFPAISNRGRREEERRGHMFLMPRRSVTVSWELLWHGFMNVPSSLCTIHLLPPLYGLLANIDGTHISPYSDDISKQMRTTIASPVRRKLFVDHLLEDGLNSEDRRNTTSILKVWVI